MFSRLFFFLLNYVILRHLIIADNNQISYEEANKKSCKAIEYTFYEPFTVERKCAYCKLKNCLVRIVKFLFLTIDSSCILAHNRFR